MTNSKKVIRSAENCEVAVNIYLWFLRQVRDYRLRALTSAESFRKHVS